MSQIKCKAAMGDVVVDVQAGWDRPLAEFFLTIFRAVDDEVLWTSNAEVFGPSPHPPDRTSTLRLRAKLVELQIAVPPGFWEAVELREANVVHTYRDEKWVRSEFR
jgi:hypothetical protein